MDKYDKYFHHIHSYLALRKAIGFIGFLLPFILMVFSFLIFKEELTQKSISHYYYTDMRNVLVGALCAVGLFMFFYSGYDKCDNWAGNVAGIFAIGIAWFPTTEVGVSNWVGKTHFACATIFFLTLSYFSLFLFTKTDKESPSPEKLKRNVIYRICGIIMIICLIAIAIYQIFIFDDNVQSCFVFLAETVALLAFGISWLAKGETLYPDKK